MKKPELAELPPNAEAIMGVFDAKERPMPGDGLTEAELSEALGGAEDLRSGLEELVRRYLLQKDISGTGERWLLTLEGQGYLLLRREEEPEKRPYSSFPDFSEWGPLPDDMTIWEEFVEALTKRREKAQADVVDEAVRVVMRAAAVDTAAIEGLYSTDRGFTFAVAKQSAAWQAAFQERGPNALQIFEDQLGGFELALDVATSEVPISEAWLRALHEKVCASQETYRVRTEIGWQEQRLPKGEYKTMPNSPITHDGRLHEYAPPGPDTQMEMTRLISQLASPEFSEAHPILQASYAHYALAVIHPFADGNGRVGRALASVFFLRAYSFPLVVFVDQRAEYFDALEAADEGTYHQLIRFFLDRGLDTMGLITEALRAASGTRLDQAARKLRKLFAFPGGVTPEELTAIGRRLLSTVETSLSEKFRELGVPEEMVSMEVSHVEDSNSAPAPYRKLAVRTAKSGLHVVLTSSAPAEFRVGGLYRVLASTDSSERYIFRVERFNAEPALLVRFDEVHPTQSASFVLRLNMWAENHLAEQVEVLANGAARALQKGYQD